MDAKNLKQVFMTEIWRELKGSDIPFTDEVMELVNVFGEALQPQIDLLVEAINTQIESTRDRIPDDWIFMDSLPTIQEEPELSSTWVKFTSDCSAYDDAIEKINIMHKETMMKNTNNFKIPVFIDSEKDSRDESHHILDAINYSLQGLKRYDFVSSPKDCIVTLPQGMEFIDLKYSLDCKIEPIPVLGVFGESKECSHKNKRKIDLFTSSMYECVDCKKDLGNA